MSIILSKKLEDEVLKDNFPSSFSIEPRSSDRFFYLYKQMICDIVYSCYNMYQEKEPIKYDT